MSTRKITCSAKDPFMCGRIDKLTGQSHGMLFIKDQAARRETVPSFEEWMADMAFDESLETQQSFSD